MSADNRQVYVNNNREAYDILLKEQACVRKKSSCDSQCEGCPFYNTPFELDKALTYVLAVLQQRSPELYFADTVISLLNKFTKEPKNV